MGFPEVHTALHTQRTNPFGKTVFIDGTNGDSSNSGLSPDSAVTTIALGLTASAAGDTLMFAPGTYTVDVSAGSADALANQTWMAAIPSFGGAPNVIISADADDHANAPISVDVNGVVFKDIRFQLVAGGTVALYCIDAAQGSAVVGLSFVDCWFDLNAVDGIASTAACAFNDASNTITGLTMQRCRFLGGSGTTQAMTYIHVGVVGIPEALIEDCVFGMMSIDGDCRGMKFDDPGAPGKSYGMTIRNNSFVGPTDNGSDAIAIEFTAAMTDGEIQGCISGNICAGCTAVSFTVNELSKSIVRNFVTDASGGALIDSSA